MASAVAMIAEASPATWASFISEVFIALSRLALGQDHLRGLLCCGEVRLGALHLAGRGPVDALTGHPLGVIALGVGQQLVEAVALAQHGGVAGFQEVGGDVMGNISTEAADKLPELAANLGIPHRPGAVAFAVSHGVIRPSLERL